MAPARSSASMAAARWSDKGGGGDRYSPPHRNHDAAVMSGKPHANCEGTGPVLDSPCIQSWEGHHEDWPIFLSLEYRQESDPGGSRARRSFHASRNGPSIIGAGPDH